MVLPDRADWLVWPEAELLRLLPAGSLAVEQVRRWPLPVAAALPSIIGGPDAVVNMQWQIVVAAKAKDRWEHRGCR